MFREEEFSFPAGIWANWECLEGKLLTLSIAYRSVLARSFLAADSEHLIGRGQEFSRTRVRPSSGSLLAATLGAGRSDRDRDRDRDWMDSADG